MGDWVEKLKLQQENRQGKRETALFNTWIGSVGENIGQLVAFNVGEVSR
jgi:hypothetical protein